MSRSQILAVAGFAATVALSPVSPLAQVPGAIPLGERPAGDVVFRAPALPAAEENGRYSYSLCLGTAPAMPANQECGGSFHPSTTIQGGRGPYHFQLDSGSGFPPMGVHLDKDGNLTGTLPKGARASTFRVCAVDLGGAQSCQTVTINVGAAAAAGRTPSDVNITNTGAPEKTGMSGAAKAGILLGVAGGAGVGVALMCQQTEGGCAGLGGDDGGSSSCGSAPAMPAGCEGSQRNSSVCNAWISSYRSWCSCTGHTFNVNTGSCS